MPLFHFSCSYISRLITYAVTFSRIDPEGKLVMGYRKATNTVSLKVWYYALGLHNNATFRVYLFVIIYVNCNWFT